MRVIQTTLLAGFIAATLPVFADSQRPTAINNISVDAESQSAISISWTKPSDNTGIEGYNVYRNGGYYTTIYNATSYTDDNVSSGQQYQYYVVAFDAARNYATKGTQVTASADGSSSSSSSNGSGSNTSTSSNTNNNSSSSPTSVASGKPSAPDSIDVQINSSSSATLSWDAPSGGAEGYNIYLNGSYDTTVKSGTSYTANNLSSSRSYEFEVVAFRNNEYSTKSPSVTVKTDGSSTQTVSVKDTSSSSNGSSNESNDDSNDNSSSGSTSTSSEVTASSKPSAPSGVSAELNSSSSVTLSWSAPSGGAEGYNVYKDGSYYSTVKGRTNYTANNLSSNRSYDFEVVAFRNRQFSTKSSSVTVQTSGSSTQSSNNNTSPPPDTDTNTGTSSSSGKSAVPSNYTMVFNEEFNSRSINASKWNTSYRWGADWVINNEDQYYVDTQRNPDFGVTPFKFNGSTMTIQATKTPSSLRSKARDQRYLSGALTTYKHFQMTYGYVEMRAKLPRGKGLWPAFWLLHQTESGSRPEIDVVEMLGDNTRRVYQTYHYYENYNLRSTPSFQANDYDYANDFHTYGMLWEPGKITWYIDGVATNTYQSSKVSNESMYILLNLAMGGGWAGSPDSSTPFPANFEIDYVRAYQRR